MNRVKHLAARFYPVKSGHGPVWTYLKRFGHRDDDKCWWCSGGGRTVAQTWEHLFRHCSRWKDHQTMLWKEVGNTTGWRVSRCRHVKVSELLSIQKCDQAVIDFLVATDVGKFPPKMDQGGRAGGQRADELELPGYGRQNKSLQTLLDFISFPLYSMLTSLSDAFFLSVFLYCIKRGRRVAGVELRHLAGQPGGGGD